MIDYKELSKMRALSDCRSKLPIPHRWAVYLNSRNQDLQFLATGKGFAYENPPADFPIDNERGFGWQYHFCGFVELVLGNIIYTDFEDVVPIPG